MEAQISSCSWLLTMRLSPKTYALKWVPIFDKLATAPPHSSIYVERSIFSYDCPLLLCSAYVDLHVNVQNDWVLYSWSPHGFATPWLDRMQWRPQLGGMEIKASERGRKCYSLLAYPSIRPWYDLHMIGPCLIEVFHSF